MVSYQEMYFHVIFDVKLEENVRRKVRLVAGGHKTNDPPIMCCVSTVHREPVRISLLDAELNGLNVLSCDIQNACLSVPHR